MTQSPLLSATAFSRPFWEAAREHRLVRPWCPRCSVSFFPPSLCCPHCLETGWSWVASAGVGSVYSFTRVFRAPVAGFATPYVVAIVDLEPGFSLLTNIIEEESAPVSIGDGVAVDWTGPTPGLPVFRLMLADDRSVA